jgi:DNA-binding winged helix-turn-helix (wHTH) protein
MSNINLGWFEIDSTPRGLKQTYHRVIGQTTNINAYAFALAAFLAKHLNETLSREALHSVMRANAMQPARLTDAISSLREALAEKHGVHKANQILHSDAQSVILRPVDSDYVYTPEPKPEPRRITSSFLSLETVGGEGPGRRAAEHTPVDELMAQYVRPIPETPAPSGDEDTETEAEETEEHDDDEAEAETAAEAEADPDDKKEDAASAPEEGADEEAPYQQPRTVTKEREPDILFKTASDVRTEKNRARKKARLAKKAAQKTTPAKSKKPAAPEAKAEFQGAAKRVGPHKLPGRMVLRRGLAIAYDPRQTKSPAVIEGTDLRLGLSHYQALAHLFERAERPVQAETLGKKYFSGSSTPRSSALAAITKLRAAFDEAGHNGKSIIETTDEGHVLHVQAVKNDQAKRARKAKGRKLRL